MPSENEAERKNSLQCAWAALSYIQFVLLTDLTSTTPLANLHTLTKDLERAAQSARVIITDADDQMPNL